MDLSVFEKNIKYPFKNKDLLMNALTHSSYINEHRLGREHCNERLEFLGDAILEFISSEQIYKDFMGHNEGDLSRLRASLVCESALAQDAKAIDLSSYLLLGKGEEKSGGRYRDSVVSDAMEALIGAIYLDGGIREAKKFVKTFILNEPDNPENTIDSKTKLQIITQERFNLAPEYRITGSNGPDHDKLFTADVLVDDKVFGTGVGKTKKQAEKAAAKAALHQLKGK